jgi:hypothetical protein
MYAISRLWTTGAQRARRLSAALVAVSVIVCLCAPTEATATSPSGARSGHTTSGGPRTALLSDAVPVWLLISIGIVLLIIGVGLLLLVGRRRTARRAVR